jgi:hypothetical protein
MEKKILKENDDLGVPHDFSETSTSTHRKQSQQRIHMGEINGTCLCTGGHVGTSSMSFLCPPHMSHEKYSYPVQV